MTQEQIQEQIEAIRKGSVEFLKSKESARQFLIDAGIILPDKKKSAKSTAKKK